MAGTRTLSIGGASGYWGEAAFATRQLLSSGGLDFIVYDYLAEITMSIMARARGKDPAMGYATDFVTAAMAPNMPEIARQGVRIVSNAGGVNPLACAAALRAVIDTQELGLKVAVVLGDDLISRGGDFALAGITEMFSGEPFPDQAAIASINAYLGAFPIAKALDDGADIVITGRCVDSAVTLGACIHAFGWGADDLDLLAAGSLAGHIIECGPQANGGNFTDWRDVPDIANIGYPVVEIAADGNFDVTKPAGTGGLVSRATVCEQMLYEIGDPQAYLLPDVTCDFSEVIVGDDGDNRVSVAGTKGYPPPADYKVSATYLDGYRGGQLMTFNGFEAREKALVFADAVIERAKNALRSANAADFDEVSVETLGGQAGAAAGYGDITLKLAVRHKDARAIGAFLKELVGMALATPPGLTFFTGGGRSKPSPVVRLFSFLLGKDAVAISIDHGTGPEPFVKPRSVSGPSTPAPITPPFENLTDTPETVAVPLIALAWARSGDKGDKANIGVIARQPEFLPWIWRALSPDLVSQCFSQFLQGSVERYYLPGIHAMNIVLNDVLGGGGIASLRNDAQGKGYAQMLLAVPVEIPVALASNLPGEWRS